MYILSRDRLNMDLDRASLDLMLRLLELEQGHSGSDAQLSAKEMAKVKEKIRKLCETVHNKHLDLENITVGWAGRSSCPALVLVLPAGVLLLELCGPGLGLAWLGSLPSNEPSSPGLSLSPFPLSLSLLEG